MSLFTRGSLEENSLSKRPLLADQPDPGQPDQMQERFLTMSDGCKLWLSQWQAPAPQAHLLIVHGFGDCAARHLHTAKFFQQAGFSGSLYDLRSHGRSDGQRGDIFSYHRLCEDLQEILHATQNSFGQIPIFLLGFSFGGQLVAKTLLSLPRLQSLVAGQVLVAPWFQLVVRPHWWQHPLLAVARVLAPGLQQPTELKVRQLSDDDTHYQIIQEAYGHLLYQKISVRAYLQATAMGRSLLLDAENLDVPSFVLHGSEDGVTSPEASRAFFERLAAKQKAYQLWPGMRHELQNSTARHEVFQAIHAWIVGQLSQTTQPS
ncbi:MAG: alpha/beta fold hydrolase [Verrucomicrobiales bacterium]